MYSTPYSSVYTSIFLLHFTWKKVGGLVRTYMRAVLVAYCSAPAPYLLVPYVLKDPGGPELRARDRRSSRLGASNQYKRKGKKNKFEKGQRQARTLVLAMTFHWGKDGKLRLTWSCGGCVLCYATSVAKLSCNWTAPSILKKHPINHTWVKLEGCMYVMFLIGNSGLSESIIGTVNNKSANYKLLFIYF